MDFSSIGGGIGGLIGSLVGSSNASGDFQNANEAAQKAAQQLINTGMPPDLAKQVVLQQYQSAGKLTPDLEKAINLGPSAVANINVDPTTRNAQMAALQQYQQASQTGQTAQDQLNNQKMLNQINSDNQSRQQSIIQGAQARGESGSGASLAAQLANAQGSANNESNQGLQLAANANQARLAALSGAASLGGQINSQDFNQANTKASAADQFQRFNVQNQQNVANQNVNAKNQAQAANLANTQQLSNANVGQNNQEAERQNQAQLTDWQAQNQRNQIINQGYKQSAGNYNSQGNAVANQATQMGAGLGGVLGAGISQAFGSAATPAAAPAAAKATTTSDNTNSGYSPFANYAAHGGLIQDAPSISQFSLPKAIPVYFDNGGVVPNQQPMQTPPQMPQPGMPMQGQSSAPMYMQQPPQQSFAPATGLLKAAQGAMVPGHASIPGDHYVNDKIHAMLSPGEAIIPRSIMNSPDAPERAKEFIKGILASKKYQG